MALNNAELQTQLNNAQAQQNDNIAFQQDMATLAAKGERELTQINVLRTYESGRNASVSKQAETNAKIGKMGADASNKLWG